MTGTIEGGKNASRTNRARYGEDFYVHMGRLGGRVKNPLKGFGTDKRSIKDKMMGVPKLAAVAGKKGGTISKRGKSIEQL